MRKKQNINSINEITEYNLGGIKWVRETKSKRDEVWTSHKWLAYDNKPVKLRIDTSLKLEFELYCFSDKHRSMIAIDTESFELLWSKAFQNIQKEIKNYTYVEQCLELANWLCTMFCKTDLNASIITTKGLIYSGDELTEYNIGEIKWTRKDKLETNEEWLSQWHNDDNTPARLYIFTHFKYGFELNCFDNCPNSVIAIDLSDFALVWDKAFKGTNKEIKDYTYTQRCIELANHFCQFFCTINNPSSN